MGNGEQASSIRLYRVCEAYDMGQEYNHHAVLIL
jgi:hypothetical protein